MTRTSTTPSKNSTKGPASDPYKGMTIAAGVLFITTLPVLLGVIFFNMHPEQKLRPDLMPAGAYAQVPIVSGSEIYAKSCRACHGPEGHGIPKLGKPLRNSKFVQDSSDEELFNLIAGGRLPTDPLNTTGMPMPARGAMNIPDSEITSVISYLREMQDPSQPYASVEAWIAPPPPQADVNLADVKGHDIFVASCSACHGPNGEGMEGLGKPFTTSEFVAKSTDKELMTMIKMGRPIWDAANTTGIDMPPKGGNPALTDDELADIITYIRSIDTVSK